MDEGIRFSQLYLERTSPVRDSVRLRNRLAAFYTDNFSSSANEIITALKLETGAEIPYIMNVGFYLPDFSKKNELRDVLDSITIINQVLTSKGFSGTSTRWLEFVSRAFKEENVGYRLDAQGVVHYHVDEEYERNRFSTLSALDNPKYNNSRSAFEDAYRHMDNNPIDTKAAVRSIFESIEILVKQMVDTNNLNQHIVKNNLKDKCMALYNDSGTSSKVTDGLFESFAIWVNTIHHYRHGQDEADPVAPSEEKAVYILSSGTAFLRWLLEINNSLQQQ